MKFSVIIPVYNAAKYLKGAIDSVLCQDQSRGFDADIILVENGSTDDSGRICNEYAAAYQMITTFHREKIGAYAARRLGMEMASGDWLLFLDADDELAKDALFYLKEFISGFSDHESAPDIIFYDYEKVAGSSMAIRTFPFDAGKVYKGREKKKIYDVMCQGDLLNPLWNKCVKKQLATASLSEDPTIFLNHGEDLLQTAQLIDRAEGIAYLDRTIYRYRCDNQGLSGAYHEEYLDNQKHAWEELEYFAQKWADDPSEYMGMIGERKSLTCCIAAKSLILSGMKRKEASKKLHELLEDPFFAEHGRGDLPKWAPEEDVFYHGLIKSANPYKMLMNNMDKHRIKAFIKERIRK